MGNAIIREQLAAKLGVSTSTLTEWMNAGVLKESLEELVALEENIRRYKEELKEEETRLVKQIKDIKEDKEFFRHPNLVLSLFTKAYSALTGEMFLKKTEYDAVYYFLGGMSIADIAKELCSTKSYIREVIKKGFGRLDNATKYTEIRRENIEYAWELRSLRNRVKCMESELMSFRELGLFAESQTVLAKKLDDRDLYMFSKGTVSRLKDQGVETVADLVRLTEQEFLNIPGIRGLAIRQVRELFFDYNLKFGMTKEEIETYIQRENEESKSKPYVVFP